MSVSNSNGVNFNSKFFLFPVFLSVVSNSNGVNFNKFFRVIFSNGGESFKLQRSKF